MKLFVVSDIHGMYEPFEKLIENWDRESKLIILGDIIDRGPDSYRMVRKVMALIEEYGEQVVFVKGNHEDLFLKYVSDPETNYVRYFINGGIETIQSFLPHVDTEDLMENAQLLKEQFSEEISFLQNRPLYYVHEKVLFTHAGFDPKQTHWQLTSERDFIWIRNHYLEPNETGYVNVFGHTPTRYIHETDNVWISPCQTYIGVDGGCVYDGQLNGILMDEQGVILNMFIVKDERVISFS